MYFEWDGSSEVGNSIKHTCIADGAKGLAKFHTSNEGKEIINAVYGDLTVYMFRDELENKIIKMRVEASSKFYIYFSQSKVSSSILGIEINENIIDIFNISILWNYKTSLKSKSVPKPRSAVYDIWLHVSKTNKLTIGSWKDSGDSTTYTFIENKNINEMNYIGFSSKYSAVWEVQNGN